MVGPQTCWLSGKCDHKHQEHCESSGSQDMLGLNGYSVQEVQLCDFSEEETEA